MGYMRHHAIIVTSFDDDLAIKAQEKAIELGMLVTCIAQDKVNFNSSFLVCPDGSNEGWVESNKGDFRRAALVQWLDDQREKEDDSTCIDWVEVQYGDEEHETLIVRDSDERSRAHDVLQRGSA